MAKLLVFVLVLGFAVCTQEANLKSSQSSRGIGAGNFETFYNERDRAYHAKFYQSPQKICTILSMDWVRKFRFTTNDDDLNALHVTKKIAAQPLEERRREYVESGKIFEIYGRREDVVKTHLDLHCKSVKMVEKMSQQIQAEEPEVRKIVDSGHQDNRIDVVFMGDGYTLEEKEKFFQDMQRLTQDMFEGVTYRSHLPFFNIWAIFVESMDSGIGYNGPQNTPFELYREQGELRVIWPGNTNYARQICQLTGTNGCDFPSLIANDDFYGGLGGEFVVSTRSNRTGTVVLRHEMGHSFIDVGDEYDNSWAYGGANSANSVANLGWGHWLTGTAREERATYRVLAYPWHDLSLGSETITFDSDGTYSRWYMLVSVSAAGEQDSLEFLLDGEILPWTTTGFDDREFYSWNGDSGFSAGSHTIVVRSKTNSTHPNIPRMICSVNLHEFGSEEEFEISNDYVSAYPVWDVDLVKRFRPTNAGCLMRNMTHTSLCDICKEGMWMSFLQKVSLIDEVLVYTEEEPLRVVVSTLELGPFRKPGNEVEGEELNVSWFHQGVEQEMLKDQFEIFPQLSGNWKVQIEFKTPEVRVDPTNLMSDSVDFVVPNL